MPTSELSNALNPYITQERPRQQVAEYQTALQQVAPIPQQYVPHRSELELAISEPQPLPQPVTQNHPALKPRNQLFQEGLHPIQEFLRLIATTRDAQEIERKRRLAWEQEQEAKFAQRQAEMERTILEMRQEIQTLRTTLNRHPNGYIPTQLQEQSQSSNSTPVQPMPKRPAGPMNGMFPVPPPAIQENVSQQPSTMSTGPSQPVVQHPFVQGPPSEPYGSCPQSSQTVSSLSHMPQQHMLYPARAAQLRTLSPHLSQCQGMYQTRVNVQQLSPIESETAQQSLTPSPSPQPSVSQPLTDSSYSRKKRKSSETSTDGEGDIDSDDVAPVRRIRRINHHDKRCLTIQHAMRLHFMRCMELETDKQLPDSHEEGATFDNSQPVRFVWDKTTKQSIHNARMKTRILADLKAKRNLYKHVADKDFGKKILDAAFEQCFVTFRQKFKAQRDAAVAMNLKQREDQKARRSRHLSRRKLKLTNRAEARQKLPAFEHLVFDGALQLECMSSEESDEHESGSPAAPKSSGVLRTRGYAWRSSRLIRFYYTLDDEERSDKSTKAKRGVGKRGRSVGPPKEGFHLPPKGVATWMISRRWLATTQREQPDLAETLSRLVLDPPGFDWDRFDLLGLESDIEGDETRQHEIQNMHIQQLNVMQLGQAQYSNTSSLNYALA